MNFDALDILKKFQKFPIFRILHIDSDASEAYMISIQTDQETYANTIQSLTSPRNDSEKNGTFLRELRKIHQKFQDFQPKWVEIA